MYLGTAFLLGLVGSLHCVGMCGPLVLALPVPPGSRFRYRLGRVLYHLGRLLTYGLMGLLFGTLGKTASLAGLQGWLSIVLGALLLIGLFTTPRLAVSMPLSRSVHALKSSIGTWLRRRSLLALPVLGSLTGLLPCGLVYVACAAAAATGGVMNGMVYMLAFGLGTVPLMLALTFSSGLLRSHFRAALSRLVPVSVFLLASLLILRGMGLGIPYLSPDLRVPEHGCCAPATSAPATSPDPGAPPGP